MTTDSTGTLRADPTPSPAEGSLRVLQYRVHDLGYPRNARLRGHLRQAGHTVTVFRGSAAGPRLLRLARDLVALTRASWQHDVVVLSELRLAHAPYVGLVGRLTRSLVVVDGFVGLHETEVGDWKRVEPRSLRARLYRLQDRLAVRAAHVYLIDTEVRAEGIRRSPGGSLVLSLPVGAPAWARALPPRAADGVLRLLYYGNYIPLHGLDLVVEALALMHGRRPVQLTLVGDGGTRGAVESRVHERGLDPVCRFVDPVAEDRLAGLIAEADVVLGVFGSSPKARSVIANKVWQGLACRRVVVTSASEALDEIADAAGPLLVTTTPGSARSLADALVALVPGERAAAVPDVDDRLDEVVAVAWRRLDDVLDDLARTVRPRGLAARLAGRP